MGFETQGVVVGTKFKLETQNVVVGNSRCCCKKQPKIGRNYKASSITNNNQERMLHKNIKKKEKLAKQKNKMIK
jgi:hypothetical protein